AEIADPCISDGIGDRAGECRVAKQQPAPGCDSIGLVIETFGEHLSQVFDGYRAKQFGVNGGNSVGAVRTDNGQVCHSNLALSTLLDYARAHCASFIPRETTPNLVDQAPVNLKDDFQMTREHVLKPRERPFLESFGQQRMVRVCKCIFCDVPGRLPSEMRVVKQDSHQLGDCQCRVGVIELDGYLFWEPVPIIVAVPEAPHQIGQGSGDQEVLLYEAERLPYA